MSPFLSQKCLSPESLGQNPGSNSPASLGRPGRPVGRGPWRASGRATLTPGRARRVLGPSQGRPGGGGRRAEHHVGARRGRGGGYRAPTPTCRTHPAPLKGNGKVTPRGGAGERAGPVAPASLRRARSPQRWERGLWASRGRGVGKRPDAARGRAPPASPAARGRRLRPQPPAPTCARPPGAPPPRNRNILPSPGVRVHAASGVRARPRGPAPAPPRAGPGGRPGDRRWSPVRLRAGRGRETRPAENLV